MSRAFSTMKDNVATEMQDTSTAMKTLIGKFLNRRYMSVLRAINWQAINDDYTVSVTSGTQDYELPSDFGKEVACWDSTNNTKIEVGDLGRLWQEFGDQITTAGTVSRAAVWTNDSGTQYIKFHYKPASNITVALPYIVRPTELSSDSDTTVIPIEDLLECGARADSYRYKKQFAKAAVEEAAFERMLADHIWDSENQPNRITQFLPSTFNRENLY